jgi:hypothetical protein
MSFFSINMVYIIDLVGKMPTKVWFIKSVHNKIQIDKAIERVQDKQHKKQFWIGTWSMMNYNPKWL